jgi:hypothetical protein
LYQILEPPHRARITALFFTLLHSLHCPQGGIPGLLSCFARRYLLLDPLIEMELKFFVQFPI